MNFCIPIPCFFSELDFSEAVRRSSKLGFAAVEIYNWKNLNFTDVKKALDETGVELISMCTTEFNMTNPEFRTKWLCGLRESCEAANALGVKRLITQVGQDTGAERRFQHQSIVDCLNEAKPILEKYGVTIMIEPLNTYVNHPGYYLWSSREAFDIIKEVNHPFVKVVYDIYHQQIMEGNIIPNITENLQYIAHLHAAGHPGRHELQYGESDYRVIFAAADRAGYEGFCGLEYTPTMPSEESLAKFREIYIN